MTKYISAILILFLALSACDKKEKESLLDLLISEKKLEIDTSESITRETLLAKFDTIPNKYGKQIIEEVLIALGDKSVLKQIYTTGYLRRVDTVKTTMFQRTNLRLDPKNQLSEKSYFFVIILGNINDYSLAAPFFLDLENNKIGMFSIPDKGRTIDSLHHFETLDELKERLTKKTNTNN